MEAIFAALVCCGITCCLVRLLTIAFNNMGDL